MPPPPFPSDGFSGVVRSGGESWAFGLADRAHEIPNTVETQFAVASGTKGFTAVVARRVLPLDLRARDLLGPDLPLIDDRVTVQHLLTHTSGIGDYFDEDVHPDPETYVMPVPIRASRRPLLDLPVEQVLVSHGAPVVADAVRQLHDTIV